MIRPKSAVYLSLAYNYNSKQQAINAKNKFKQTLITAPSQLQSQQLCQQKNQNIFMKKMYRDEGPSFLSTVKQGYISKQSREKQNKKKLNACRKISRKSMKNIMTSLKSISSETVRLNRFLQQNKMPQNFSLAMRHKMFETYTLKKKPRKENQFFSKQRLTQ